MEVRGKSTRGLRKVYILLQPDMKVGLEFILKTRGDVGIPETNKYVFSRPTAETPLDGCKCIRDVISSCPGLILPEAIRTRLLRKYLATTLQVSDMLKAIVKKRNKEFS